MSDNSDTNVVATSALLGGVATLIQELVASGAINAERLTTRLQDFVAQESVKEEPEPEREIIHRIITTLIAGIKLGQQERQDHDAH